ncbi:helix-turn-helix transcriptional regulator [Rathayibacter soli]|uniref:helix-turn-helix transcriptional regulator n=1 Tax=Rathayibacter soli TaxID=3144168 RepID=UPI0027E58B07|nr:helix-turn-helix domain-containing protein [Glaciibacter superstes]
MQSSTTDRLSAIAAVSDPVRRALFELVGNHEQPISRDDAAAALGLARSTAAFHLDRLVEEGLLTVEFKRLTGRTGPGAGRPSKLYSRATDEISVSIPERHYELAGELLASAIDDADRTGSPVRESLASVAEQTGRELGAAAASLEGALQQCGYEPYEDGRGGMLLANCPFHRLSTSHADVICHANLDLLRGMAVGVGDDTHDVVFAPGEGPCCVRIAARGVPTEAAAPGVPTKTAAPGVPDASR